MNKHLKHIESILQSTDNVESKIQQISNSLFIKIIGDPVENPLGWERFKIGDKFSIETGKRLRRADMDSYGKYSVYGGNGILGKHSEYSYKEQKVIIGRVGAYCGNAIVSEEKSWITGNAIIVHEDETDYDKYFLSQMFQVLDLNRLATGSAQKYLSTKTIKNQHGLKPPKSLQRMFSHFMKKIESIEKACEKRNNLLKKLNRIVSENFS